MGNDVRKGMVCADGGNPDPTSPHGKDAAGKDAARARQLEAGWTYPRHLAVARARAGETEPGSDLHDPRPK
jgi:hypothetical protein